MDDDATLPAVPPTPYVGGSGSSSENAPTNPASKSGGVHAELERYDLGALLGRGGMGEVRLAKDARIEREVAVKLMRGDRADPETIARFFREAKVQGALEHPAVVPVHDLGVDAKGNPFFVMKRLAGTTLADVIGDRPAAKDWPRRKLLGRFVDVCMAVAFAHDRGVIHRDLKPSNIMLGDFGEAYVLDWGLAKIDDDDSSLTGISSASGDEARTQVGAMLGTPGYLAPEQARGEKVDYRADVYGLGCVLFEILVGTPALPRGIAAVSEALVTEELRPSTRATDIPPELDELCARATAQDRRKRPTARALADGIQAYLDGDRDLSARRELAQTHARRARECLAKTDDDSRAEAMREAGRALALDANNALAQSVMSRLLIEGPEIIPEGALIAADAERAATRMKTVRWAAGAYFGLAAAGSILFFLPIREYWLVTLAIALCCALGSFAIYLGRTPMPMVSRQYVAFILLNGILLALSGMLFGPLFLTPILLVGSYAAFIVQPTAHSAWFILGAHVVPLLAVTVLEFAGVFPASFSVENGMLLLRPWVLELTPASMGVLVVLTIVLQLVNNTIILLPARRDQEHVQDRLHAQRWHLGKLLPMDAPDLTTDRPPLQAILPSESAPKR